MKLKTPEEIDELPRNKLVEYIESLHMKVDKAQRELAESVRDELDIKFTYDALIRKYNIVITEFGQLLIETYDVDRITSSQIIREIDQHAASEAATYPHGGCSG